ncbi:R-phenyllactate dehydratase activator [Clostridium puniceum]|uniref:R-phenyllactate dehydratase activator n=1 Tax=Clostridium puniceum TaxID=29367 RepID=A0A1S8TKS2_9CLOT|nr:R-phenyllactate dehydratase activator [Clostridium puniceum]
MLEEADKIVTEITCHSQGAAFLNPTIRGVIDIGGQDSKVILLDDSLNVVDFLMNDKCAAGTGRFVEVMMRTLEEEMANIDEFVKNRNPVNISSMCTVFAESEIISLLAKDVHRGDIALGIIHSICRRTSNFAQKLSLHGDIFFSGGLALSEAFRENLEGYLNRKVLTNDLCQYAGAIGAAVIGYRKIKI